MMTSVRSGALLLVMMIGLLGVYGSASSPCSGDEGDSPLCTRTGGGGSGSGSGTSNTPTAPSPVIPTPVVAINDRGIGFVAYPQEGGISVQRFNGAAGFEGAAPVASGFEQDLAIGMAGAQVRLAWRGANGRVSVLTGDETGTWQPQADVAASAADDPFIASDEHTSAPNNFVAWRLGTTQSNGFPATSGYGSVTLLAPHALLTRYATDEDVAPSSLFELRAATVGPHVAAVWVAAQRSDSSIVHIYASRLADGIWSEAVRLAPALAGSQSTALGMDADGNAIAVWPQVEGVFYSRYSVAADSWSVPAAIRTEVSPLGQVQIDVAPNGRAIAAWSMVGGGVWAAEYDLAAGRWTDIHRLDLSAATDSLNGQDPRVAIDGVGRAIVVWRGGGRAYANEHERSSGWTLPELLGATASPLDLDVDDDGLGVAVWWQDGLRSRIWNRAGAPSASFTFDPDPGVAGQSLLFDAQASSGPFPITQYLWHWDDGSPDSSGGAVLTHAFEAPGNYTASLQITDSAAQTASATRTVHVAPIGELSSRVVVNYVGPGDGTLEIHSAQPGFTTVVCSTHTGAGQPTDTGACSATVLAGYEITIVAAYDPVRTIFSGWTEERRHACATLSSSSAPGGTRAECHFAATSQDRTFDVSFAVAPPATHILRIQLSETSLGDGVLFSTPTLVNCTVHGQEILNSSGGVCSYSIAPGTTITVFAAPVGGSSFIAWQGCDALPTDLQCTVTMTALRTITARFGGP
jgi:hypothetical protein